MSKLARMAQEALRQYAAGETEGGGFAPDGRDGMREIKFRAWDTYSKRMVDLHLITPLVMDANLLASGVKGLFLPFDQNIELMQYTGLKDRKGTEIYEGDVLMVEGFGIGIVEYGKGCYRIRASDSLAALEDTSSMLIEVISNIYENPAYLLGL